MRTIKKKARLLLLVTTLVLIPSQVQAFELPEGFSFVTEGTDTLTSTANKVNVVRADFNNDGIEDSVALATDEKALYLIEQISGHTSEPLKIYDELNELYQISLSLQGTKDLKLTWSNNPVGGYESFEMGYLLAENPSENPSFILNRYEVKTRGEGHGKATFDFNTQKLSYQFARWNKTFTHEIMPALKTRIVKDPAMFDFGSLQYADDYVLGFTQ